MATASAASSSSPEPPAPILTLDRVIVRAYLPSDAPSLAKHANDPAISQWMTNRFPSPYTLADSEYFINTIALVQTRSSTASSPPTDLLVNYALFRRSDGAYLGGIGLKPLADVEARGVELGYWVGREFWGQGYVTEAVRGFTAWAFATFPELLRVEAGLFEGNVASAKVVTKAGFRAEGVRRKAVWKNGRALDMVYYGMLREECPGLVDGAEVKTR